MRLARVLVCALLILRLPSLCPAQQAPSAPVTSPQASALLQGALGALTGGQSVRDVTLNGSVRRIAGSDDESGTATLKAIAVGASSVSISLPSGQRNEVMNVSTTPEAGSWSGPDGTIHQVAYYNLLPGPFWFFPALALSVNASTAGAKIAYIGHEDHNGQAVEHITVSQSSSFNDPASASSYARLTQLDFFLDSTTFLPAALGFSIHPDNNQLLEIPVEIRFGGYAKVDGVQIPFHVQKFVNNTLTMDLQFQSAAVNSGLAAGSFAMIEQ